MNEGLKVKKKECDRVDRRMWGERDRDEQGFDIGQKD